MFKRHIKLQFFTQPNNDLERNYFYSVKISLRNHLAMIKENKYFLVEDFIEYDSPADDRSQCGGVGRYLQTNKQTN